MRYRNVQLYHLLVKSQYCAMARKLIIGFSRSYYLKGPLRCPERNNRDNPTIPIISQISNRVASLLCLLRFLSQRQTSLHDSEKPVVNKLIQLTFFSSFWNEKINETYIVWRVGSYFSTKWYETKTHQLSILTIYFKICNYMFLRIKFSSVVFLILCSERFLSSVHEYTPEMTVAEKRSGGNYKL